MAGPQGPSIRRAALAGRFYPADADECRALAQRYTRAPGVEEGPNWIGGIVPHAGWICSAAIAGQTLSAMRRQTPDVVVVFGAIHTPIPIESAALDSFDQWDVPGALCDVQPELRNRLTQSRDLFRVDDRFHEREHAIEVELPLIRSVWPNAVLLPVEVPPNPHAGSIGKVTAQAIAAMKVNAVFLASSDLTHYGPAYGFAPAGTGPAAMHWAKHNDRPLLEMVLGLKDDAILPEVGAHHNACGAGAIVAMLTACKEFGANRAKLLRHATSIETLAEVAPQPPDNSVGYASVVIG